MGKDNAGVEYAAKIGVDGVISTKIGIIKCAKKCNLKAVQRIFIVDSHSYLTALDCLNAAKPNAVEIMPGILPRAISWLFKKVNIPIIAGGLIESKEDVDTAVAAGAVAVSTTKTELWQSKC